MKKFFAIFCKEKRLEILMQGYKRSSLPLQIFLFTLILGYGLIPILEI